MHPRELNVPIANQQIPQHILLYAHVDHRLAKAWSIRFCQDLSLRVCQMSQSEFLGMTITHIFAWNEAARPDSSPASSLKLCEEPDMDNACSMQKVTKPI